MSEPLRTIHNAMEFKTPYYDRAIMERIAARNTPEYLKRARTELGLAAQGA